MSILPVALVALSFALSAAAQRVNRGSRARRIAGGAIAGIAIGCVVFVLLLCLCCALLFRRRRARNAGGLNQPGTSGWGNSGVVGGGPAAQEAGYAQGPGNNAGWKADGQPAHGGGAYQPPQGPPPGAPQPGGFAPPPGAPPAAYTRPY